MTDNRNWQNFPVYRNELSNIISALVTTAVASGASGEYLNGFMAAASAIVTAAGLQGDVQEKSIVTVEGRKQLSVQR